jgi:hypothetical protein
MREIAIIFYGLPRLCVKSVFITKITGSASFVINRYLETEHFSALMIVAMKAKNTSI